MAAERRKRDREERETARGFEREGERRRSAFVKRRQERDGRRGEPRERLNGSKTRGKIAIAACTDELICVT